MSEDPRSIIQQVAAQNSIGNYAWIPLGIAYGESGLNPTKIWSDPTPKNPNATAGGLFAYHDDGRGRGWGDRRKDPWAITQDVMPAMAKAIKQGEAQGLQGLDLFKYVWFTVEVPADTPQAHQNMAKAFQWVQGGGNVPEDGYNATLGVDYPSGGTPQNVDIIPGPNGIPLAYRVKFADGETLTLTPEQYRNLVATGNPNPKTPAPDSPAQTLTADANYRSAAASVISANASAKNADTSRLNGIVDAIDTIIKTQGIPAEQALKLFQAKIQNITLQQNQDVAQGDFGLRADDQNLRRTTAMNTDAREREIQEQQRKVDLQRVATDRAQSLARDVLPSAIPGATSMTLPMLGEMPLTQVNPDQFYSQGLPPLIDQWNNPIASSAPNPWGEPTTAPQLNPLALPTVPEPQPPVDIDAILNMVRGWM